MLDPSEYTRLSRTIAHALRHAPEQYGIALDAEGWTGLDVLLDVLRQKRPACRRGRLNRRTCAITES